MIMSNIKEKKATIIKGKIWILGDSINTDQIVPSRVLTEQDPNKLIAATLENEIPEFAQNVKKGDFIVAGKDFGSGSSREEAVFVFKELGLAGIIAESYSRIYFRNCINLGLPPIIAFQEDTRIPVSPTEIGVNGDQIIINFTTGALKNSTTGKTFVFDHFPIFLQKYLDHGGVIEYLKNNN